MRRLWILSVCLFTVMGAAVLPAQESEVSSPQADEFEPRGHFPRVRGRMLMLDIHARVIEQNQTVVWDESHKKSTIPGRPVGIKLVGANVIVAAQFTPYVRRGVQTFLVAQGQVWVEVPNQGIRYHTSMQTIPLQFGEPIYYLPLGPLREGDAARIEVMITLYPYDEN